MNTWTQTKPNEWRKGTFIVRREGHLTERSYRLYQIEQGEEMRLPHHSFGTLEAAQHWTRNDTAAKNRRAVSSVAKGGRYR